MSTIKISNSGIEISSDRYLTDNSTGLFFLLNLIILVKQDCLTCIPSDLFTNLPLNVLLGFILILLSNAIGLIISTLSFVMIEIPYVLLEYCWWKCKIPLYPVQFKETFTEMLNEHDVKSYSSWHKQLIMFEEELIKKGVNIDRFLIQRGIRVLLRNLSFVLLLDFFLNLYTPWCTHSWWLLVIALLLLIFSSYIGFFANFGLLLRYHVIKQKDEK